MQQQPLCMAKRVGEVSVQTSRELYMKHRLVNLHKIWVKFVQTSRRVSKFRYAHPAQVIEWETCE